MKETISPSSNKGLLLKERSCSEGKVIALRAKNLREFHSFKSSPPAQRALLNTGANSFLLNDLTLLNWQPNHSVSLQTMMNGWMTCDFNPFQQYFSHIRMVGG